MSEPAAPVGARLKAERERRGLSAQKAADEMHLDRWVIDALETGDYKRIGPTVYAKGHLKKYAALLGLPSAEILAGYDSGGVSHAEPYTAGPSMLLNSDDDAPAWGRLSPTQLLGGVSLALLLIGILWWKPWHQRVKPTNLPPVAAAPDASAAGASESPAVSGIMSATAASPALARETSSATTPGETATGSSAASAPSVADAVAAPTPGTGRARLRLSFSADSWVDVHDAAGRRTFAGNGLANSVKTIAGVAPMRVYLGFGSGVQLEINDRAVAIGPQFFAGDVARFEAGADGVLRRDSHPEQTHGAPSRNARPPG